MPKADVQKELSRVPLFRSLSTDMLAMLADLAEERRFESGDLVFREGDAGDAWYVITTGEVRIVREVGGPEGEQKLLTALAPGSSFGEMAVFDDAPRSATAVAHGETRLIAFGRDGIHELLEGRPSDVARLLMAIISNVSASLRRATTELITVYETGKLAGTVRDPKFLSRQILERVHFAVGADRSAIGLWNPFSEEYEWIRHEPAGAPEGSPAEGLLAPEHPLVIGAFEQGEAIVVEVRPEMRSDEPWLGATAIVVPLYAENVGQGIMLLASDRDGVFGGDQQRLANAVAAQIAGALALARREQEDRDRGRLEQMRARSMAHL